jgi:hypothetical protein
MHFASDILKRNAAALHFLGPLDDDELRAAVPLLLPAGAVFDWCAVLDWARKIGNLPRYLLKQELVELRVLSIATAVKEMTPARVTSILLYSRGIGDGSINVEGTLFELSAARALDTSGEPVPFGYDGEAGVDYTTPSLKLMNDYVFQELAGAERANILSYWAVKDPADRSKMGATVENLVWGDLKGRCLFRTWNLSSQTRISSPDLKLVSKKRTGCTIADLKNVFASGNELVRMAPRTPLIDFAGPGRRVYQATVSADHSMSLSGLQDVLKAAGYMEDKAGACVMVQNVSLPKLDYFWVVPEEIFSKWMDRDRPKTVNDEQVRLTLTTYVNQFVLSVDTKRPNANGIAKFIKAQPVLEREPNFVYAGRVSKESQAEIEAMMKPLGVKRQENVDDWTLFLFKGSGTNDKQKKVIAAQDCGTQHVDASKFDAKTFDAKTLVEYEMQRTMRISLKLGLKCCVTHD